MKKLSILLAVFLVLVMVFSLSLSVLAFIPDLPNDEEDDNGEIIDPPVQEPPTKVKGNNGFGNGDQDAPGNSKEHNNAENANDGDGREYPGKSGH